MATPFALIVLLYAFAYFLVSKIIYPTQLLLMPDVAPYASLCFLPHGIRTIATWYYKRAAIIPLFIAAAAVGYYYQYPAPLGIQLGLALWSASAAYLAFTLMDQVGLYSFFDPNQPISRPYVPIFVGGFIASILNMLGLLAVSQQIMFSDITVSATLALAIGDFLGLVMTFVLLSLWFRVERKFIWLTNRR